MQIERVEMVNWRPFHGLHAVELATESGKPYVWIHANNMRGKTSIINAIRWCLYGDTLDSGHKRPDHINLNKAAISRGDFKMSVKMEFTHEGRLFVLERQVQWRSSPTSDAGKEERVDLRENGMIQPADAIAVRLQTILPPDISQFFLFDGEMIREFEERLHASHGADFVRHAISLVVGVPALKRGAEDLESLKTKTEAEANRLLKAQKKNAELADNLERNRVSLEATKADLEKLEREEERLEADRADTATQLRRLQDVAQRVRERDLLEDEADRLKDELEELHRQSAALLQESWWAAATSKIEIAQDAIEQQHDQALTRQANARAIRRQIEEIEVTLQRGLCSLCGQSLGTEFRAKVEAELEALRSSLASAAQGSPDEGPTASLLHGLKAFRGRPLRTLIDSAKRASQLELDIFERRTRIHEINEVIKASDAEDAARLQRQLEALTADLATTRQLRRQAQEKRSALENQRNTLRQQLLKVPDIGDRVTRKLRLLSALESTFSAAVARFRDSVRANVESQAQVLFKVLTTEPEFQGISVSEDYEVRILDATGSPVAPSAAAQQVSALALIGGLKAAAVREGPLVIDTPLARFDIGHRDRVLDTLPRMGGQVVLLLHPGEFDRARYIDRLGGRVSRELTLKRESDQESRLVPGYNQVALS